MLQAAPQSAAIRNPFWFTDEAHRTCTDRERKNKVGKQALQSVQTFQLSWKKKRSACQLKPFNLLATFQLSNGMTWNSMHNLASQNYIRAVGDRHHSGGRNHLRFLYVQWHCTEHMLLCTSPLKYCCRGKFQLCNAVVLSTRQQSADPSNPALFCCWISWQLNCCAYFPKL